LTTVISQTYIDFGRQFPHPEVLPVMGYEENKDNEAHIPHPATARIILILFLSYPALQKCLFSSDLPTNIQYALLISTMHTMYSAHPILFNLVTLIIFGEENNSFIT
jgi:hypothetical protein